MKEAPDSFTGRVEILLLGRSDQPDPRLLTLDAFNRIEPFISAIVGLLPR